ncbi:hypothetical protein A3F66_05105 [candidate division TM6 bacterium RIFCSPHIGHO2_12_FULL_32_22]|nr:MAG: hypothetical protein A3F66_05105 [candidate division TM6 bacterium RIFCSPHIGHO2_12_FULL_32_22]
MKSVYSLVFLGMFVTNYCYKQSDRDKVNKCQSDCNLVNTDLSSANLSYLDLTNAKLTNANLRYADLTRATLTNADLTNADLSSANLTNANLSNAIWADGRKCASYSIGKCN